MTSKPTDVLTGARFFQYRGNLSSYFLQAGVGAITGSTGVVGKVANWILAL